MADNVVISNKNILNYWLSAYKVSAFRFNGI